jgi:subtilisin family serine protease
MDMDTVLPGPDDIRVLALLRKDGRPWLVDAAQALLEGRAWRSDDAVAGLPAEFKLDPSFCSVALGPTAPSEFDFARVVDKIALANDLKPENSDYFVIRGFVKASGFQLVPRNIGDLELYSDPSICTLLTCGTDPAVGSVADVRNKLGAAKLATALPVPLDGAGVAVAMADSGIFLQHLTRVNLLTGVNEALLMRPRPAYPLPPRSTGDPPVLDPGNSWTPPKVATPPGGHRIGHGTMCAYNALSIAPRARLLDYPSLIARAPGNHTVSATVGAAMQAYAKLIAFWIDNLVLAGPYKALVLNNSWGIFHPCEEDVSPGQPGRFIDNPIHPFHFLVWFLGVLGADIVFAAGNGGLPCPAPPFLHLTTGSIRGANAYREVLSVAGCDVNDGRVGYSSQGPAVAMFPLPTEQKPDLAAYTHFLGSQVFGEREPDSGTSTACAIAAGCVAALRSHPNISPAAVPPADLFATLRSTARQVGSPGWNRDYGYGIIDPVAAARALGVTIP